MSIPKKIHWCWLSGDPLPKIVQRCINSWKRVMPDYEIILWDKQRFDIHSVKFVEDACNARKWAFAADFIRLYALYYEGGIYLDSDVKVYRRFDKFLHHAAFSSVAYLHHNEYSNYTGYSIGAESFGAEKGNPWIKMCLDHYINEKEFKLDEYGKVAVEVIPNVLGRYAHDYFGFHGNEHYDTPQPLKDGIVIYPEHVFSSSYGELSLFHTISIHSAMGTWHKNNFVIKRDILLPLRMLHHYAMTHCWLFRRLHYKRKQLQNKFKNRKQVK